FSHPICLIFSLQYSATPGRYPLSLHDALPISGTGKYDEHNQLVSVTPAPYVGGLAKIDGRPVALGGEDFTVRGGTTFGSARRKRSEEHTSELQSREKLVCRLLLEKKKNLKYAK